MSPLSFLMNIAIKIVTGLLLIIIGAFIATAYITHRFELYEGVLPYIESTTELGYVHGIVESKHMVMVRVPDSLRKGPTYDIGFNGDIEFVNFVNGYELTISHYVNKDQKALMKIYVDGTSYQMYKVGDDIDVRIKTSQSR